MDVPRYRAGVSFNQWQRDELYDVDVSELSGIQPWIDLGYLVPTADSDLLTDSTVITTVGPVGDDGPDQSLFV